mgnify:CR=1 FL=1
MGAHCCAPMTPTKRILVLVPAIKRGTNYSNWRAYNELPTCATGDLELFRRWVPNPLPGIFAEDLKPLNHTLEEHQSCPFGFIWRHIFGMLAEPTNQSTHLIAHFFGDMSLDEITKGFHTNLYLVCHCRTS